MTNLITITEVLTRLAESLNEGGLSSEELVEFLEYLARDSSTPGVIADSCEVVFEWYSEEKSRLEAETELEEED